MEAEDYLRVKRQARRSVDMFMTIRGEVNLTDLVTRLRDSGDETAAEVIEDLADELRYWHRRAGQRHGRFSVDL